MPNFLTRCRSTELDFNEIQCLLFIIDDSLFIIDNSLFSSSTVCISSTTIYFFHHRRLLVIIKFLLERRSIITTGKTTATTAFSVRTSGVKNGSYKNLTIEDNAYSISYNEYWADYIESLLYTDLDKVIISIILPIVVTIGIIGNLLTIIVIARKKCMHTPVNVYFANLAIADTLFLITAPELIWNSYIKSPVNDWYDIGEVPKWVCPLTWFLISTGQIVALFTIFWLSVEHYMAVCRPLKFKQSGFGICSRSIKICGIIWFLCLSWNVYFLIVFRTRNPELSLPLIAVDTLPNNFTYCGTSMESEINWLSIRF
ncbi:neuromedin-U receptor 2-like [Anneissia japonica]|uniref:neuromedin-U receptor 2-like n=1 Tax=Anneissia japonica TaxID=1529436 RepID=UPI00142592D4|nr:neuromedin-U receptor 2-like [Anneissia japonica]